LAQRYGVQADVVPVGTGDGERERLQAVAEAGARQLDEMLEPGMTVGMAWGTTINAMVSNLRSRPVRGLRIVQLSGALNNGGTGDGDRERLQAGAEAGARQLDSMLEPGMTVGMAWGTTINAMVSNLRSRPVPGLRIVQLNGAINTEGSGHTYVSTVLARAAALWDATVHHFPVPAFFDYAATREAMWRERSVQRVLDTQRQCTLAVFSVGAFDAAVPSHVYTNNYLTGADLHSLRSDGAVGDVC